MPVTILRTRDGTLDADDRDALLALEERIGSGSPKILLHLHGGLVKEADGIDAANRLSGSGETAFNVPGDWEQIYVIWRTGAMETLRTNWRDIFTNDRLYRTLFKRLMSLLSHNIGVPGEEGRSVGQAMNLTAEEVGRRLSEGNDHPFADIDARAGTADSSSRATLLESDEDEVENEALRELNLDSDLESVAADIEAALTRDDPAHARDYANGDPTGGEVTLQKVSSKISAQWVPPEESGARSIGGIRILFNLAKHGAAIAKRVFRRYRAGKDHGLHATLAEELVREFYGDLIGSIVWGMMKDDAADHFAQGKLGDELLRIFARNSKRRLLVTAHSAGTIWASEMMLAAHRKRQALPVDLLFMAPAVRTAKFAEALAVKSGEIGKFRIYAMQDALERADVLLGTGMGFLYPSSLLYFVSGLCEESDGSALANAPLLGMQRFLDKDCPWLEDAGEGESLRQVQDFLAAGDRRAIFAKSSAGDGLNTDSTSHGSFDNNTATLASIATFFKS